jgi:hypothetical protein
MFLSASSTSKLLPLLRCESASVVELHGVTCQDIISRARNRIARSRAQLHEDGCEGAVAACRWLHAGGWGSYCLQDCKLHATAGLHFAE